MQEAIAEVIDTDTAMVIVLDIMLDGETLTEETCIVIKINGTITFTKKMKTLSETKTFQDKPTESVLNSLQKIKIMFMLIRMAMSREKQIKVGNKEIKMDGHRIKIYKEIIRELSTGIENTKTVKKVIKGTIAD